MGMLSDKGTIDSTREIRLSLGDQRGVMDNVLATLRSGRKASTASTTLE